MAAESVFIAAAATSRMIGRATSCPALREARKIERAPESRRDDRPGDQRSGGDLGENRAVRQDAGCGFARDQCLDTGDRPDLVFEIDAEPMFGRSLLDQRAYAVPRLRQDERAGQRIREGDRPLLHMPGGRNENEILLIERPLPEAGYIGDLIGQNQIDIRPMQAVHQEMAHFLRQAHGELRRALGDEQQQLRSDDLHEAGRQAKADGFARVVEHFAARVMLVVSTTRTNTSVGADSCPLRHELHSSSRTNLPRGMSV